MRGRTPLPLLLAAAALPCAACGTRALAPEEVRAERETALRQIAAKCGLPRSAFHLATDETLRFRPPADASYQSVDCGLAELRKRDLLKDMPLGFVGNEMPGPEDR
jgi:hypothetical protein